MFGRARAQAEGLRRTEEAHRRETMAALRVSFLSALVLELLATLSVAVVAVGIGLRVVEGHLDLATALFVLMLAPEAYLPLRQVGSHYHDSADGLAAAEQAFAPDRRRGAGTRTAPAEPSPIPPPAPSSSGRRPGALPRRRPPTRWPGWTWSSGPGETVALAGPSGGGKSTALAAAARACTRPTAGRVLVGGAGPRRPRPRRLAAPGWPGCRSSPPCCAGTVGSNVALGAPGAPDAAGSAQALDRAGAPDLDLDQPVEAGTEGLSAGEIRRVALARALLRVDCGGGQLLMMDEPTAGLDADTELAAVAGVRALGVSTVVVSHRPAVLAAADRVVDARRVRGGDRVSAPACRVDRRLVGAVALSTAASGAGVALMATSAWLLSRAAEHPPVLFLMVAIVGVRALRPEPRRLPLRRAAGRPRRGPAGASRRCASGCIEALADGTWVGRRSGDLLSRVVNDVAAVQDRVVRVDRPGDRGRPGGRGHRRRAHRVWPPAGLLVAAATVLGAGVVPVLAGPALRTPATARWPPCAARSPRR